MLLLWLAALPCLFWAQGMDGAPGLRAAGVERLCVPPEEVEAWRGAGFEASPLAPAELQEREAVPAPGIRMLARRASPTRSPWIDASGHRFRRNPVGRFRYQLPAGKAALAAAEAYAYGADAVLEIDAADVEALGRMQAFLSALPAAELRDVADLGVVDDRSATMTEVLNLLARRNLLFRIVREPSAEFGVNVKLGTPEYPARAALDLNALILTIRRRLSDDARSLRLFGSEVVIARLTGDGSRLRLHLLNYGVREIEGLRVRLRGAHPSGRALVAGHGPLELEDRLTEGGFTEFTVPRLGPYGVVDLPAPR